MERNHEIVIIGAGFAGLSLAKKLIKANFEVLLIDKNNYHTFQPLLYQVATGGLEPSNIAYPIRRIFREEKNIRLLMAEVQEILPSENKIKTSLGEVGYRHLIIATGSTNNFFNFEPIKEYFLPLKSVPDALKIKAHIVNNLERLNMQDETAIDELMNIAVIGAGPAGVEIAGILAEMKHKVLPKDYPEFDFDRMNIYLFEAKDKVLPVMSEKSSTYSLKYLQELGVDVLLGTMVKDFDERKIMLESGESYYCNTVIWTAGVKGAPVNGLEQELIDRGNRILVNKFNQVLPYQNIYAIGDVAAHYDTENPRGLPMLAQVAIQQGSHLAKNLINLRQGKTLVPFAYQDKGVMATVGKNKAVVELPKLKLQGFIAWFIWMFVHLLALIGFRNRIITVIDWIQNYANYDRPLSAIFRRYEN
ncbi:MAG: NAD(P)/FAD-dependent oxidoreductase [Chitinophagales bacterium]|nr:NAD(P)/FAD-dependent oxidoreductase [Bacteroidota bacterium]MCB9043372.1 NAD(P)/FAD-dependent oxidoreductase [Chitinophagales bacterium]